MEIREADIAAMGRAELEELIDRAVRPDVPLRVLFAALDRYTELLRPALDDGPQPGTGSGSGAHARHPAGAPTLAHAAPEAPPITIPVASPSSGEVRAAGATGLDAFSGMTTH